MNIIKLKKHRLLLNIITFTLITVFLCQNISFAGDIFNKNYLAPESRLVPFFEEHGLGVQNICKVVMVVSRLKKVILGKVKADIVKEIESLNKYLSDKKIEIREIRDRKIRCSETKIKYAILEFKETGDKVEVLFIKEHKILTNEELKELGIGDKKKHHLDCPGLEGIWFIYQKKGEKGSDPFSVEGEYQEFLVDAKTTIRNSIKKLKDNPACRNAVRVAKVTEDYLTKMATAWVEGVSTADPPIAPSEFLSYDITFSPSNASAAEFDKDKASEFINRKLRDFFKNDAPKILPEQIAIFKYIYGQKIEGISAKAFPLVNKIVIEEGILSDREQLEWILIHEALQFLFPGFDNQFLNEAVIYWLTGLILGKEPPGQYSDAVSALGEIVGEGNIKEQMLEAFKTGDISQLRKAIGEEYFLMLIHLKLFELFGRISSNLRSPDVFRILAKKLELQRRLNRLNIDRFLKAKIDWNEHQAVRTKMNIIDDVVEALEVIRLNRKHKITFADINVNLSNVFGETLTVRPVKDRILLDIKEGDDWLPESMQERSIDPNSIRHNTQRIISIIQREMTKHAFSFSVFLIGSTVVEKEGADVDVLVGGLVDDNHRKEIRELRGAIQRWLQFEFGMGESLTHHILSVFRIEMIALENTIAKYGRAYRITPDKVFEITYKTNIAPASNGTTTVGQVVSNSSVNVLSTKDVMPISFFMRLFIEKLRNEQLIDPSGEFQERDRKLIYTSDLKVKGDSSDILGTAGCYTCVPIICRTTKGTESYNHLVHFVAVSHKDYNLTLEGNKHEMDRYFQYVGNEECIFVLPIDQMYKELFIDLSRYITEKYRNCKVLLINVTTETTGKVKTAIVMKEGIGIDIGDGDRLNASVPKEGTSQTIYISWEELHSMFGAERIILVNHEQLLDKSSPITSLAIPLAKEKGHGAFSTTKTTSASNDVDEYKPAGAGMNFEYLQEFARRSSTTAKDLVGYIKLTGIYYQIGIIRNALSSDPEKLAEFNRLLFGTPNWPSQIPDKQSTDFDSAIIKPLATLKDILATISVERNLGIYKVLSQAQRKELVDTLKELASSEIDKFTEARDKAVQKLGFPKEDWPQKQWIEFARLILFELNQSLFIFRGWLIDIGTEPDLIMGGQFLRPVRGRVLKYDLIKDGDQVVIIVEIRDVDQKIIEGNQLIPDARAVFRKPAYILFNEENDEFLDKQYDEILSFANTEEAKRELPAVTQILGRLSSISKIKYRQIQKRLAIQEEWNHYKNYQQQDEISKNLGKGISVEQFIKIVFPEDLINPLEKAVRDHLLSQAEMWSKTEEYAQMLIRIVHESKEMLNKILLSPTLDEFLVALIEVVLLTSNSDNEHMYSSRLILHIIEEILKGQIITADSKKVREQIDFPEIARVGHEELWKILKGLGKPDGEKGEINPPKDSPADSVSYTADEGRKANTSTMPGAKAPIADYMKIKTMLTGAGGGVVFPERAEPATLTASQSGSCVENEFSPPITPAIQPSDTSREKGASASPRNVVAKINTRFSLIKQTIFMARHGKKQPLLKSNLPRHMVIQPSDKAAMDLPVYQLSDGDAGKVVYIGQEAWGSAVLLSVDLGTDIYTDLAKNCQPLLMRLAKDGKPYILLAHIRHSFSVRDTKNVIKLLKTRGMIPAQIIYSPRKDSRDADTCIKILEDFLKKSICVIPRERRTNAKAMVTGDGWVIESGLKKNRQRITKQWGEGLPTVFGTNTAETEESKMPVERAQSQTALFTMLPLFETYSWVFASQLDVLREIEKAIVVNGFNFPGFLNIETGRKDREWKLMNHAIGIIIENLFHHEYKFNENLIMRVYIAEEPCKGVRVEFWGPGKVDLPAVLKAKRWFSHLDRPWETPVAPAEVRSKTTTGAGEAIGTHLFNNFKMIEEGWGFPSDRHILIGWREDSNNEGSRPNGHIISLHLPVFSSDGNVSPALLAATNKGDGDQPSVPDLAKKVAAEGSEVVQEEIKLSDVTTAMLLEKDRVGIPEFLGWSEFYKDGDIGRYPSFVEIYNKTPMAGGNEAQYVHAFLKALSWVDGALTVRHHPQTRKELESIKNYLGELLVIRFPNYQGIPLSKIPVLFQEYVKAYEARKLFSEYFSDKNFIDLLENLDTEVKRFFPEVAADLIMEFSYRQNFDKTYQILTEDYPDIFTHAREKAFRAVLEFSRSKDGQEFVRLLGQFLAFKTVQAKQRSNKIFNKTIPGRENPNISAQRKPFYVLGSGANPILAFEGLPEDRETVFVDNDTFIVVYLKRVAELLNVSHKVKVQQEDMFGMQLEEASIGTLGLSNLALYIGHLDIPDSWYQMLVNSLVPGGQLIVDFNENAQSRAAHEPILERISGAIKRDGRGEWKVEFGHIDRDDMFVAGQKGYSDLLYAYKTVYVFTKPLSEVQTQEAPGADEFSDDNASVTKKQNEYTDKNKALFKDMLGEGKQNILLRVPLKAVESTGINNIKDFMNAFQWHSDGTPTNGYVELYDIKGVGDVGESEYKRLGIRRKPLPEDLKDYRKLTRENTITLFTASKDEEVRASTVLDKLGKIGLEPTNTILSPIGLEDDQLGLLRGTILGLRLLSMARQKKETGEIDDDFVDETVKICEDIEFNIKGEDLINIATGDINKLIEALNKIIKLLPIKPVIDEDLKQIYEHAAKVLTAA